MHLISAVLGVLLEGFAAMFIANEAEWIQSQKSNAKQGDNLTVPCCRRHNSA